MSEATHEWDSSYQQAGQAPWDIGRPQPAIQARADDGTFSGNVLDAGCGTGEHALLAASKGANATGVDIAEPAIRIAEQKAAERGITATFRAGDILTMSLPDNGFDAAIDSGLFHVFNDADRGRYVAVLARTVRPGGVVWLMCFSDRQPGDWGPRRVTKAELEAAFADGWDVERIEPSEFDINPVYGETKVQAWLAVLRRT